MSRKGNVLLVERIESRRIAAFVAKFEHCALRAADIVAILSESQSRCVLVELAELAALQLGARAFRIVLPSPGPPVTTAIRSTGAARLLAFVARSRRQPRRLRGLARRLGTESAARWAMAFYDKRDCNGTELRAFAGNIHFSTGVNEVAGRHTLDHFDLPMRGCSVALDDELRVDVGRPV